MQKLRVVGFVAGAFLFVFGTLFAWQVWAQDDSNSGGNNTLYLPWISMPRTQTQSAEAASKVITETEWILKPGEYEGFVPTPFPTVPFPDWVKPVEPGQPPVVDNRPSKEELEILSQNYISPDTPYQLTVTVDHFTDSESAALLSETIVIAKVRKIYPSRWSTPDGERPANPYDWTHPSYIFTLADIEVQEVLKGTVKPSETLTIVRNGGKVGDEWLVVDSYLAELREGEILFLYTDPITAPVPGTYWRINERYTIDLSTNQATNPIEKRAVDDLRQEVVVTEKQ